MVRVAAVALACGLVPACGAAPAPARPRYRYTFTAEGPVFDGDDAWFTVVRDQAGSDGEVYAVRCSRSALRSPSPACSWHLLEVQLTASDDELDARAAAARDHACSVDRVVIQSPANDGALGFWLEVCGVQRFYRYTSGRWIDATP
jgi:hypothetical protein